MGAAITADDLAVLTQWDTPTICNALEEIMPERRGYGFTTTHLFSLDPSLPPICGFARTATIRAAEPSDESAAEMAAKRAAYYEYVAAAPTPTIVIIQDIDPQPGVGAFWGEVQTNIHKGLGVLGAVTNGSFRDVPDSARGFNLIGGKVGPSHAFVHLVDIDCQVTVHGLTAKTNDIIHADQHGAVFIPPSAITQIPAAVDLISRREAVILETAKSPDFTVEKLKIAMGQ
ncbi:MAG: RraA family protein, partial [Rhodobacteraceae bacterium]|nr:RraA family protein [Paracoccaceae bacterium]